MDPLTAKGSTGNTLEKRFSLYILRVGFQHVCNIIYGRSGVAEDHINCQIDRRRGIRGLANFFPQEGC